MAVDNRALLEARQPYEEAVAVDLLLRLATALDRTLFADEHRILNRHDKRHSYRKARYSCGGGHHHGHDHETSRACTNRCAHELVDLCPDYDFDLFYRFHDENDPAAFYQVGARHGQLAENVDRHETKDGERRISITNAFSKWYLYMKPDCT